MKRNCIQFWYGEDRDILTLVYKSEYIIVHLAPNSDFNMINSEVFLGIRYLIKDTLRTVSASMLKSLYTENSQEQYYHHFQQYQFGFKCYKHSVSGMDHLCVVSDKEEKGIPKFMDCVNDGSPVIMKPEHLVWYDMVRCGGIHYAIFY